MGCIKTKPTKPFSLILDPTTDIYDIQFNPEYKKIDPIIKQNLTNQINMLNSMANLYKLTYLTINAKIPIVFYGLLTPQEHKTIITAYNLFKDAITETDILMCLTQDITQIYAKHKSIYQSATNFIKKTDQLFWHIKYERGITDFYDLLAKRAIHNINDLSINTYNNEDSFHNRNCELVRL